MKLAANILLCVLLGTDFISAADWPRFRGPNAAGVAPDHAGLPTTWSTTENVKWVADLPGLGWSCPVVWGDRVFLTTVVSDQPTQVPEKGMYLGEGVRDPSRGIHRWMVYCFDLSTGEKLWQHEAHVGQPQVPRHPKSTYAAETPTTDGQRLYVLFGDLGLWCYDLEGELLWVRRIEPKKTELDYGAASSPVVHDGQVFVVYDNLEESWIAAFDAQTGEERWRAARDETRSWSTPLVWENSVRTEIVVAGENRNRGYSLDGELLWEFNGRMGKLVIPSPLTAHGFCYISSGFVAESHRPTFALKPGVGGDFAPDGDYSNKESFAWYQDKSGSYNPSQIVYGDYLYTLYDQGFLTCHHARTGEEIYGKQRFSPSGSFTASPFAYNGKLFCLSEDCLTYVIQPGPNFEILATNSLDERSLACPAIAGDKLLIRTASKLYCFSEEAKWEATK
jgi:outer membrane protein assembly factor BamB